MSRSAKAMKSLGSSLVAALAFGIWMLAGGATGAAAADVDSCPNAAIRAQQNATHLPDCRAYEQVSPIDKNGNHALVENPAELTTLSPGISTASGDDIMYTSFGSFPGAKGANAGGNPYVANRNDGWNSIGLAPPTAAVFPLIGVDLYGATTDLKKQLLYTTADLAPGAVEGNYNLYVHETATDSYELVDTVLTRTPFWQELSLYFVGASEDGSRWYFRESGGTINSTPAQANGSGSMNIYEYSNGTVKLVNVMPDGSASTFGASPGGSNGGFGPYVAQRVVAADGRQMFWSPYFGGGYAADTIYLYRDGESSVVTKRETDDTVQQGRFWFASRDGSQAFISSEDQLTADASPSGYDLYRYDRDSGDLVDLTPTASAAGVGAVLGTSEDGSYVYFQATGALASGATQGDNNIYVWHDDQLKLVASSSTAFGTDVGGNLTHARVSPNGKYFGFIVDGALGGPHPQTDPGADSVYVYDSEADSLQCASCTSGDASSDAIFETLAGNIGNSVMQGNRPGVTRNVLDNGRVYFSTQAPLVDGDSNGQFDVYEYNDGVLSLLSDGQSGQPSLFVDASADGDEVFFTTESHLVGQDKDSLFDLYTASVDGGLSAQNPAPPAPACSGDGCQDSPRGAPDADQPGSEGYTGDPDSGASPKCRQLRVTAAKRKSQARRATKRARARARQSAKLDRRARHASGKRARRLHAKSDRLKASGRRSKRKASRLSRASAQAERQARMCRRAR